MSFRGLAAVCALGLAVPAATPRVEAQEASAPLEVGAEAPDFALSGATRHGVLAEPVRLSDYRGKTVVLAFFFRARTRG